MRRRIHVRGFPCRLDFHRKHGSLGAFVVRLEAYLQAAPTDGAALNHFLRASEALGTHTDTAWVARVATPRLFADCVLAALVRGIKGGQQALAFLERAEGLEITDEDGEVFMQAGWRLHGPVEVHDADGGSTRHHRDVPAAWQRSEGPGPDGSWVAEAPVAFPRKA
ncbi:MAG: hypothetical protein R3F05_03775 [Planctomycetota bacterium]